MMVSFQVRKLSEVANYVGAVWVDLKRCYHRISLQELYQDAIQSTAFITKNENTLLDSALMLLANQLNM